MTTATAAQCRKCEASALHLITESDIYGEYEKCLQCGEVQGDKVVGDWPDTDDAMTRVGWGWQDGRQEAAPIHHVSTLHTRDCRVAQKERCGVP